MNKREQEAINSLYMDIKNTIDDFYDHHYKCISNPAVEAIYHELEGMRCRLEAMGAREEVEDDD